jgi:tRNA threonylcarbamoyladenosine biosynthesis protein TsaB
MAADKINLLILDSCGSEGGVAVATLSPNSPPRMISRSLPGKTFSSGLVRAVREVLEESGLALAALNAIVVMHGPGSFTGVRVGLSAAKGLAQPSGVPVIALSRLAVMADMVKAADKIFVAMDAGRGELYFGEYESLGTRCVEETLLHREYLPQRLHGAALHFYEPSLATLLGDAVPHILMPQPGAADCIPLAMRALEAKDFADLATLDANYLRVTDVERTRPNTEPSK